MALCEEQTRLLAKAGRDMAERLLPKPFELWHSDHSAGIQMTVVVRDERGDFLPVWSGSVWHSSMYDFNDRGKVAGLQPDFAFARGVINKYFADVRAAVEDRDRRWAAAEVNRIAEAEAVKRQSLDAAKTAVANLED